ncbi:TPA: LysR family transcriptional regulator [Pseudomonas putida]
MTLTHLRAFCSVVDMGSFRAAARALNIAQSTLTQSVQALERELGGPLLHRTNQGIRLSDSGQRFIAHARAILMDCDRAVADVRALVEPQGHVALGVTSEPLAELLVPVFESFTSQHPQTRLEVTSGSTKILIEKLREGRLDFALCALPAHVDEIDLSIQRLHASRAGVIARKDHPLRDARSVRELTQCKWISVRRDGLVGGTEGRLIELFRAHGLGMPKIGITTESLLETLHIVAETDYLTIEPAIIPSLKLFSSSLVRIPIEERLSHRDVALITRKNATLTSVAQVFIGMLVSYSRLVHPRTAD